MCGHHNSNVNAYYDCQNGTESVFDVTDVDIDNIHKGDIIEGNPDYL